MNEKPQPQTLILHVSDRPGALELIAATFAHRGLSLSWTLGSDGSNDPNGSATVIVHFCATTPRKEAVKRVLSRLSRVISVTEPAARGTAVQTCAMVRLAAHAPAPNAETVCTTLVTTDAETGEAIYSLLGSPDVVALVVAFLHTAGHLKEQTQITLAL